MSPSRERPRAYRLTTTALVLIGVVSLTVGLPAAATAADGATFNGSVSVEGDPSQGLQDVLVQVVDADGNFYPVVGTPMTDSNGDFSLAGIVPGTYTVFFETNASFSGIPSEYASEWWSDEHFQSTATPIVVVADEIVVLDTALALGGSISGTVSGDQSSGPFHVEAYAMDPGTNEWVAQTQGTADEFGDYVLSGLKPGLDYRVRYSQGGSDTDYVPEFWNNAISIGSSADVSVTAGGDTANIDAVLGSAQPIPAERISGTNRFATSAQVSAEYESTEDGVVYIANGFSFADALSAAPAAAFESGPLLLVQPNSIPSVIASEIVRLEPSRIVIAGGTGVVSNGVQQQLQALVPSAQVDRVGGSNRYDTSRLLSEYAFGASGAPIAWVATGADFPDALSSAAAAGATGSPVILVKGQSDAIDAATVDLFETLGTEGVFAAGGSGVIKQTLLDSIDDLPLVDIYERVFGTNRYATSLDVYRWFNLRWTNQFTETVYLAVGTGFADALAGAALAGRDEAPMFIVPGTCIPEGIRAAIAAANPEKVVLFGGTGALSAAVANLVTCS